MKNIIDEKGNFEELSEMTNFNTKTRNILQSRVLHLVDK